MKRLLFSCLILCLIIPISIEAKKKPFGDGLFWELNKGTLIISGNGYMPDMNWRIDSKEYDFMKKFPWMKKQSQINKVIIEDGVRSISSHAFYDYKHGYVFCSVSLPSSLKIIGKYAFYNCKNLESIVIPNSVTTIGDYAFDEAGLKSVVIPSSVKTIGKSAFRNTCISTLVLPNSVKSLGESAFADCHMLTSVTLPDNMEVIPFECFLNCENLTTINFPSSLLYILSDAFRGCRNLKISKNPENVRLYGNYAFFGCKNIQQIILKNLSNEYLTYTISEYAFANCNINSIRIAKNAQCEIEKNAFAKKVVEKKSYSISDPPKVLKEFDGIIEEMPEEMMQNPEELRKYGISQNSINNYINKNNSSLSNSSTSSSIEKLSDAIERDLWGLKLGSSTKSEVLRCLNNMNAEIVSDMDEEVSVFNLKYLGNKWQIVIFHFNNSKLYGISFWDYDSGDGIFNLKRAIIESAFSVYYEKYYLKDKSVEGKKMLFSDNKTFLCYEYNSEEKKISIDYADYDMIMELNK